MMNNSDVIINVAAYCRVSTDHTDQLHSLSAQIKYFTEYISQHEGYRLKEVYYDEGITGTSVKKRVNFNRMITDAENGEIDLILTKEVSRFARNTVDTLTYTRKLSALNVGVIFMNDGIDTRDKDGELRLSIMASIAQDESRKTSERVKWGMRRKMEDGYVFGNTKLLGFRNNKGVLSIVPEEVEIVKQIFHEYLYNKKGVHAIAQELNANGVLTVVGSLWRADSVMRILKNDKYVGDLTQWKAFTVDYLSKESRKNKGEVPKVFIANHHEAIISREIWNGVQAQIEERAAVSREGRKHTSKYWFSGKVRCGICGKPYIVSGGRTKQTRTVRCINRQVHGSQNRNVNGFVVGCSNDSVNQVALNACVKHILEHIKSARKSIVNDLLLEIQNMQKIEKPIDTKPLETAIENFNRKKREAIDLMLEKIITKDDLKEQTAFYDSEIARLSEEIYNNQNAITVHQKQIAAVKSFIAEVDRAADTDSGNTELYGELVREIIVNPDRSVDFYLNCVHFGFKMTYSTRQGGWGKILICDVLSLSAIA
jgi:DNA invertase Pin-like site-specific DNA recombinase